MERIDEQPPPTDEEIEACRERIWDLTRNDLNQAVEELLDRLTPQEIRGGF